MTDLPKAQAKAKAEKKLVMLDFTGSDWCGWCIKLHKEVFSQPEFAEYAKDNLVLVEVDFPRAKKQTAELKKANQALQREIQNRGLSDHHRFELRRRKDWRDGVSGGRSESLHRRAGKTQKEILKNPAPAILALEDGSVFHGEGFGARASACGEVCFNTSMTGYQEILTDPSYKGQIVTMTYPLIGNYGVNLQDVESWRPHVGGFVIRELSPVVSNWRADFSSAEYLEHNRHSRHSGNRYARAHEKTARSRRAQRLHFHRRNFRRRSHSAREGMAGSGRRGLRQGSHAPRSVPVGRKG